MRLHKDGTAPTDGSVFVFGSNAAGYHGGGAARIVRTVASVRAERLQDISNLDAMQEGLTQLSKDGGQTWKWGIPDRDGWPGNDDIGWPWQLWEQSPYEAYRALWMGLHGVASWHTNPIVWVYDLAPVSEAA